MKPTQPSSRAIVAFDIGGTFTDVIVLQPDGTLATAKVPSLLDSVGADIAGDPALHTATAPRYIHGTTVATNALLEGRLGRVGLLCTRGFRDVLEMRSQRRPNVYDVNWQRSATLVTRELRVELDERVLADGTVEHALDPDQVQSALALFSRRGVQAIAVCLVNSYVNPVHEWAVARMVRALWPEIKLSVSSEWFSESREYERTSTTAVNAALMPIVSSYIDILKTQLSARDVDVLVMQSNGGVIDAARASERPVCIIESGPAAGVLAAAHLARHRGNKDVLAFDMGGTTAKATLICGGVPLERPGGEVGGTANVALRFFGGDGHAVRVPSFDIAEVGAGGGSIAWIDAGGALKVGPRSAGANPGPACYGRGGTLATVTDANVLLGYINPEGVAGTRFQIHAALAEQAITTHIAGPLSHSAVEAAHGIVQVANATMMRALRAASIDRGVDPRQVELIAFGGSGPVHAASLAETLGIGTVVIPPLSGIFSAIGLLLADFRHDAVRSCKGLLESLDFERIDREYAAMQHEMRTLMQSEGIAQQDIAFTQEVDVKYRGQDAALTVGMPSEAGEPSGRRARMLADFIMAFRAAYAHTRSTPVEISALRVRGTARSGLGNLTQLLTHVRGRDIGSPRPRRAWFGKAAGWCEVPVLRRGALGSAGQAGPCIVEEWDTSIIVPPRWRATERDGVVELQREAGQ